MRDELDDRAGFIVPGRDRASIVQALRHPRGRRRWCVLLCAVAAAGALGACDRSPTAPPPVDPRIAVAGHVPHTVKDRKGWADDIYASLVALDIRPTSQNVCAVVAVIEQESSFQVNPAVPDMPKIAMRAIDERAEHAGVPLALVHGALGLSSASGQTYDERIAEAHTEKDLSDIFEDFTGKVPLGKRLFEKWNPIRTRGPMQVNVAFAQQFEQTRRYPWPHEGSIDDTLFTRRGSLYFGIAHLLAYEAGYDRYLYRFADFNAGQYASRNAAFQNAVAVASKVQLIKDGALVSHEADGDAPGRTELALQMLAKQLAMRQDAIRRALQQAKSREFEETSLYKTVYSLAERMSGKPLPRALVPHIELHGPKITRQLTTEWYANRVNERFQRCERHPGAG
jgi:hypothetical protein